MHVFDTTEGPVQLKNQDDRETPLGSVIQEFPPLDSASEIISRSPINIFMENLQTVGGAELPKR